MNGGRGRGTLALGLLLCSLYCLSSVLPVHSQFQSPGCSMVGCDFAQSFDSKSLIPEQTPRLLWKNETFRGISSAAGCASNGKYLSCMGDTSTGLALVQFAGSSGEIRWSLDAPVSATVPFMGSAGDTLAYDQSLLSFIASYGEPRWSLTLLDPSPVFSPSFTMFGSQIAVMLLTFADGHVVSRGLDESPGGVLYFNATIQGSTGIFQPIGVPCSNVDFNRFYVMTRFCADAPGTGTSRAGRIYALDLVLSLAGRVKLVWTYDFWLPDGLSPSSSCPTWPSSSSSSSSSASAATTSSATATAPAPVPVAFSNGAIVFMGARDASTQRAVMFLTDVDSTPIYAGSVTVPSTLRAIAIDTSTSTGLWFTFEKSSVIWNINSTSRALLNTIDLATLLRQPSSSIVLGDYIQIGRIGNATNQQLAVVLAVQVATDWQIVALNVSSRNAVLLWSVSVPGGAAPLGQLAFVTRSNTVTFDDDKMTRRSIDHPIKVIPDQHDLHHFNPSVDDPRIIIVHTSRGIYALG